MTEDKFRSLALEFPRAVESAHMNHPDFRVAGKIFASLGSPDERWGMVELTLEQQRSFIEKAPKVFHPCSGAWGLGGATNVKLTSATVSALREALDFAWGNVVAKTKKRRG